ncbi:MAG: hypothetical protein JRF72_16665 [Deltaproteobacteria bacterium]|jgi:hypothetical protein|nr:hypothetical protein [Deltaproteobacteria bacterium]
MKILHILRTRPDETVEKLIKTSTNGDQPKAVELYGDKEEVDWSCLVDDIFSHDKVITWW